MQKIGIIVEYNPFHNGHLIHLEKVRELYPEAFVIAVMSGEFVQRGEVAIINKHERAKLATESGVDLIVELPVNYVLQSANKFAYGAIKTLNFFEVEAIVFGSESNDINVLKNIHLNDKFDHSKSYSENLLNNNLESNDILAIEYLKNIELINNKIKAIPIKREQVAYNQMSNSGNIASATLIRSLIKNDDVAYNNFMPISEQWCFNDIENYYSAFKIKILTTNCSNIHDINPEIINLFKKHINSSSSFEQLLDKCQTKRLSKSKLKRIATKIILNLTTKKFEQCEKETFINPLGFNTNGMQVLNQYKKQLNELEIATTILDLTRTSEKIYKMYDENYTNHIYIKK